MPEPETAAPMSHVTEGEPEAIYFGCWGGMGHFAHLPGMRRPRDVKTPWGVACGQLDRAPRWDTTPGRRHSGRYGAQGDAVVRHEHGWTVLAVADYTVDSRPNSHASFALPRALLTFDEALALAREHFPAVTQRVGDIREVPGGE